MLKAFSLSDGRYMLRAKLPVIGDDATQSWVNIAREGLWKGHAMGEFELSDEVFAEMLANFEAQENPAPVTYEHPEHTGNGQPIPAAGWIQELETRESDRGLELWALVEWVSDAAEMVRKGAYKFCSMVFGSSIHRETGDEVGTELFELGLTNSPFIDGLVPMKLSARSARARKKTAKAVAPVSLARRVKTMLGTRRLSMKYDKAAIEEALSALPDGADAEQFHKALEAALLAQDAAEPKAKEKAPQDAPEELSKEPVACSDVNALAEAPAGPDAQGAASELLLNALHDALPGMDDAAIVAFVSDNKDAIAKLAGKQPDEGMPAEEQKATAMSVASARAEVAEAKLLELSRRLEHFEAKEAEVKASRVEDLVDAAVEKGTILSSHRDVFIKLGRMDEADLKAQLIKLAATPVVPTGKMVHSRNQPSATSAVDAPEETIVGLLRGSGAKADSITRALENKRARDAARLNGRA